MKDHKEAWAASRSEERFLATLTEGWDYSGIRRRYVTDWLCPRCGLIVRAGRGHGHGRFEGRR